jgi:hypothetical protein
VHDGFGDKILDRTPDNVEIGGDQFAYPEKKV